MGLVATASWQPIHQEMAGNLYQFYSVIRINQGDLTIQDVYLSNSNMVILASNWRDFRICGP